MFIDNDGVVKQAREKLKNALHHDCDTPVAYVKNHPYIVGFTEGTYTGYWKGAGPCGKGTFEGTGGIFYNGLDIDTTYMYYEGDWNYGVFFGEGRKYTKLTTRTSEYDKSEAWRKAYKKMLKQSLEAFRDYMNDEQKDIVTNWDKYESDGTLEERVKTAFANFPEPEGIDYPLKEWYDIAKIEDDALLCGLGDMFQYEAELPYLFSEENMSKVKEQYIITDHVGNFSEGYKVGEGIEIIHSSGDSDDYENTMIVIGKANYIKNSLSGTARYEKYVDDKLVDTGTYDGVSYKSDSEEETESSITSEVSATSRSSTIKNPIGLYYSSSRPR